MGAVRRTGVGVRLFNGVDIAATALFSVEGAAAASGAGFDLLGTMVVGFAVGLGGGIIRDLLLGDAPPAALRAPSRMVAALLGAFGAFLVTALAPQLLELPLVYLDAVGLALFAVTGAQKAYEFGCNLLVVTILGATTAVGGGVIRDVLLQRAPYVLSESVYGTAALVGAFVTGALLNWLGRPKLALWVGFAATLVLRICAIHFDWQLPRIA